MFQPVENPRVGGLDPRLCTIFLIDVDVLRYDRPFCGAMMHVLGAVPGAKWKHDISEVSLPRVDLQFGAQRLSVMISDAGVGRARLLRFKAVYLLR